MSESIIVYSHAHTSSDAPFFLKGDIVLYAGHGGSLMRAYAAGVVDRSSDEFVVVRWWYIRTKCFQNEMEMRPETLVRIGRVVE